MLTHSHLRGLTQLTVEAVLEKLGDSGEGGRKGAVDKGGATVSMSSKLLATAGPQTGMIAEEGEGGRRGEVHKGQGGERKAGDHVALGMLVEGLHEATRQVRGGVEGGGGVGVWWWSGGRTETPWSELDR